MKHPARRIVLLGIGKRSVQMEPTRRTLSLSAREEQLLRLSAEGLTDKEIAKRLEISFSSVGSYWQRIRSKLGAGTRAELVARVMQRETEKQLREKDTFAEKLHQEIVVRERSEAELEERVRSRTLELLETIERLKFAESALMSRELQLEAILDHIPDLIIRFDRSLTIDFISRSTLRMFGGEMIDFVGKPIADVDVPIKVKEIWIKRLTEVFNRNSSQTMSIQFVGYIVKNWFEATFVPELDENNQTAFVIVVIRDISERIEAAIEIRKRREIFETMWNIASDAMVLCNIEGHIIAANPAFCNLMHLDPEEAVHIRIDEALHPSEREDFLIRLRNGIAANRDFRRPARRVQLRDGDWIECESRVSFFREEGLISNILVVAREVLLETATGESSSTGSVGFVS